MLEETEHRSLRFAEARNAITHEVPHILSNEEYRSLLTSAPVYESHLLSSHPEGLLQGIRFFAHLFRGAVIESRYSDPVFIFRILAEVGKFPTFEICHEFGWLAANYLDHGASVSFPHLVNFSESQFLSISAAPEYFLPFFTILTKSAGLSNVLESEPFFRKLGDIGRTSSSNASEVCTLLSSFITAHSLSDISCGLFLDVIDALLVPVVFQEESTAVDFTGLVAQLFVRVFELGKGDLPIWPKLCNFLITLWDLSDDVNSNLFMICDSGLPRELVAELLEIKGNEALERAIAAQADESAFELLGSLAKWRDDSTRLLPIVIRTIFEGGFSSRGSAGVCLARFIQAQPGLFAPSFTIESDEESETNFAQAAAAVLALDHVAGRIAVMDALASLHEYFLQTGQIHEFSETLDFYHIFDLLEMILGEAAENGIGKNAELALMTLRGEFV